MEYLRCSLYIMIIFFFKLKIKYFLSQNKRLDVLDVYNV